MQTPLLVRPLTTDERATLETGPRSASALTIRRCQILLASTEGQSTTTIAHTLRCTDQTVRDALHAFHQRGLAALQPQLSHPHTTATIFDLRPCEALGRCCTRVPGAAARPLAAGVRLVVCPLPSNSPRLKPIEPTWIHGKRAVSEPDRLLRAAELEARVYAYYAGKGEVHLAMPKKVA